METLSKTVAANDTEQQATLFVALELSQATWLVALHSPIAARLQAHRAGLERASRRGSDGRRPGPAGAGED